jgi:hypothetical protein
LPDKSENIVFNHENIGEKYEDYDASVEVFGRKHVEYEEE